MPEALGKVTVQDIRDYVLLSIPLMDALARHTKTKADDALVVVLRVIATNDEIAKAIEEAIGRGEGQAGA